MTSPLSRAAILVAALTAATACGTAEQDDDAASANAVTTRGAWQGAAHFSLGSDPSALDLTTAYWMAYIADLAYAEPAKARDSLATVGLHPDEFVAFQNTQTNTQGFYVARGDVSVLAFRGTQEFADFLVDAKAWTRATAFGDVHAGFLGAFESVWNDDAPGLRLSNGARGLGSFLRQRHANGENRRALYVTGHSLGGALATLAYAHAAYDKCLRTHGSAALINHANSDCVDAGIAVSSLYTFGSPRVGDGSFASWVAAPRADNVRSGIFRFVQNADIVAKVPDSFGGTLFFHPSESLVSGQQSEKQNLVYLTRDGGIDVGGRSVEFNTDTWRSHWLDSVGDHLMKGYLTVLLEHAPEGVQASQSLLTEAKATFEKVKAAYLAARPGDFVPVAAGELGGSLAVDPSYERLVRWSASFGKFFVKRTSGTLLDAAAEPEEDVRKSGYAALDIHEVYDSAFELVATFEVDPESHEVLRVEDPHDTSRR